MQVPCGSSVRVALRVPVQLELQLSNKYLSTHKALQLGFRVQRLGLQLGFRVQGLGCVIQIQLVNCGPSGSIMYPKGSM